MPPRTAPLMPLTVGQQHTSAPSAAQRLVLAIVSLALLLPLFAHGLAATTLFAAYAPIGTAITLGFLLGALRCATIVVVSWFYSRDAMQSPR